MIQNKFSKLWKPFITKNFEITSIGFSALDGCSTMSRILHGIQSYFDKSSGDLKYIYCNLELCFTYLITKYDEFVKFHSLLLNLFLLLKNSRIKLNIFEEDQNAYGLKSLKTN